MFWKIKKYGRILALFGGLVLLAFLANFIANRLPFAKKATTQATLSAPIATTKIDKTFNVDAITSDKEKSELEVTLTSAELKPQIRYKNNPLSAPPEKLFFLIRFEFKNDAPVRVAITTADYIRLIQDGKPFAPDYHNATVVVDPIAVKTDQLAFLVDKKKREFKLNLGAPEGEKQELSVNFGK